MANEVELDRDAAEVKRVHERVSKELIARIEAELTGDDEATAAVGWGMALADAMIAVSTVSHMPTGMLLEMIVRAHAEAMLRELNDRCDS